jgi:hypothetical protein
VQTISPVLPKLDAVRHQTKAAPKRGAWNVFAIEALRDFIELRIELGATRDRLALRRCPRTEL